MSVIGSLDGQVDEIIIKPLAKKNRPEKDEQQDESLTSRGATPENSEPVPARDALPVWLL